MNLVEVCFVRYFQKKKAKSLSRLSHDRFILFVYKCNYTHNTAKYIHHNMTIDKEKFIVTTYQPVENLDL